MASVLPSNGFKSLVGGFHSYASTIRRLQLSEQSNPQGATIVEMKEEIEDGKLYVTGSFKYEVEQKSHAFDGTVVTEAIDVLEDPSADVDTVFDVYAGDDDSSSEEESTPAE